MFKMSLKLTDIFSSFLTIMVSLVLASSWLSWALPPAAQRFLLHFNAGVNSTKLVSESADPIARKLSWVNGARVIYLFMATGFHVGVISAIWTPATHVEYGHMKIPDIPLLPEFASNMSVGISINFVIG